MAKNLPDVSSPFKRLLMIYLVHRRIAQSVRYACALEEHYYLHKDILTNIKYFAFLPEGLLLKEIIYHF